MHRTMLIMFLAVILAGCVSDRSTAPTEGVLKAPNIATATAGDVPTFPPAGGFVPEVTNPYLAFARGRVFRYGGQTPDGHETDVFEVTNDNKTILGVATTVVHDRVYLDGDLVEDTFDWFAQDRDGNVWYFGEKSYSIVGGVIADSAGSWEAGVNGGVPGIFMLAEPEVGTKYQQEFARGVAEDMAKVVSLSKTVVISYGTFEECLETMEWTPLGTGTRARKFYALGVGLVLELEHGGGGPRIELTAIQN